MLFRNPRLAAISKHVNEMDLDTLAKYIFMNQLQDTAKEMIYADFVKNRGPSLYIQEMIQYVPLRILLELKVTSPNALKAIKTFLIHDQQERNNDESKGAT